MSFPWKMLSECIWRRSLNPIIAVLPPSPFQKKLSLIKTPPHLIKTHLLDVFTQTPLHVASMCFCDSPLLDVHGRPLPPTFWMELVLTPYVTSIIHYWGLPQWLRGKEFACNVGNSPETRIPSLSWEDPLEEGMATHSSILAWRIPATEETGGLRSMELQSVRRDWSG